MHDWDVSPLFSIIADFDMFCNFFKLVEGHQLVLICHISTPINIFNKLMMKLVNVWSARQYWGTVIFLLKYHFYFHKKFSNLFVPRWCVPFTFNMDFKESKWYVFHLFGGYYVGSTTFSLHGRSHRWATLCLLFIWRLLCWVHYILTPWKES